MRSDRQIVIKIVSGGTKEFVREIKSALAQVEQEVEKTSQKIRKLTRDSFGGSIKVSLNTTAAEASLLRLQKASQRIAQPIALRVSGGSLREQALSGTVSGFDSNLLRQMQEFARNVREASEATKGFTSSLYQAERAVGNLNKSKLSNITDETKALGLAGSSVASFIGNVASQAVSKFTQLAVSGGSAILEYSSNLEQAKIGFTTMTGSAVLAQRHLSDLQKFAATTPFEFPDLVTASQKLQGVGINAEKIIPILTDVGNALSSAGRISDLPFATKAISDIFAKGRLQGQEILQLSNAGIPALQILSGALGKAQAEIIELGEKGRISSNVFLEALHQYSQERFGDSMQAQSKTFGGAMSNIRDSLSITSAKAFEPLYEKISQISVRVSKELSNVNSFEGALSVVFDGLGQVVGIGSEKLGEFAIENFIKGFAGKDITTKLLSSFGQGIGKGLYDAVANIEIPKSRGDKRREAMEYYKSHPIGEKVVTGGDALKDVSGISNIISAINSKVSATPSIREKFESEQAAISLKKLDSEISSLAEQIDFFGQKTQVAATKQKLLKDGITDFTTTGAKTALLLAQRLDNLKKSESVSNIIGELGQRVRFFGDESEVAAAKQKLLEAGVSNFGSAAAQTVLIVAKTIDELKKAEAAGKTIDELNTRIRFFGDETEVAAIKQKLLSQGFKDFSSETAKTALNLAAYFDKLKEADKRTKDVKDLREQIVKIREDAQFELEFTNPTKLQEFDRFVKQNAGSFRELTGEIEQTRKALEFAQFSKDFKLLLQETGGISKELDKQINSFAVKSGDGFTNQLSDIASKIQEIKNLSLQGSTDNFGVNVFPSDFAEKVKGYVSAIEVYGQAVGKVDDYGKATQSFKNYLTSLGSINLTNGEKHPLFSDKEADSFISRVQRLKEVVTGFEANQGREKALSGYAQILDGLNSKLSESGKVTEAARIQNQLLGESYQKLTQDEKDNLLSKAAQVDALKEAKESYAKFRDVIGDSVNAFKDGGFKGLFDSIKDRFKQFLADMATDFLTSTYFKLFTGANNPNGGTGGGFSLGNIFKKLTGGFGGSNNNSTPAGANVFNNPNIIKNLIGGGLPFGIGANGVQGGTFGGNSPIGALPLTPDGNLIPSDIRQARAGGNGIATILSGLGGGTEKGNLIQRLFGRVSGTPGIGGGLLGAGLGASLGKGSVIGSILGGAGGLIGGTLLTGLLTSGSIAGATTGGIFGASAGLFGLSGAATFGIGAGIAGIAALASYFIGRSSARRRDEKARTQYLQEAISGLSGFDELIRNVRTLKVEPESAIASGTTLGQNLRSQYLQQASALKDKKTREIAVRSVSELDYKIAEKMNALRAAADFAGSAIDRRNRIIPEFANGNYFTGRDDQMRDMRQSLDMRRGYINGGQIGVDRHLGLFADGEIIANKKHQQKIIQAAGFDVFAHADIPNYPKRYADGNYFAPITPAISTPVLQNATVNNSQPINITIVVEGEIDAARIKDVSIEGLASEKGVRQIVNVVQKAKLNKKI